MGLKVSCHQVWGAVFLECNYILDAALSFIRCLQIWFHNLCVYRRVRLEGLSLALIFLLFPYLMLVMRLKALPNLFSVLLIWLDLISEGELVDTPWL